MPNTKLSQRDGKRIGTIARRVRAILRELKMEAKADEERYRNILYKPYYFGLIDGEKKILKLLELILHRQER